MPTAVWRDMVKATPIYRGLRKWQVIRHYHLRGLTAARYLLRDPELSNFTYDIANRDDLAEFVARLTTSDAESAASFISELDADAEFRRELSASLQSRRHHKANPLYGRRLGWYAILRILRPNVVFETGTFDGLGAAVLGRALERNGTGKVFTFDIKPWSGWLIPGHLPVEMVVGDSKVTLPQTMERVGRPQVMLHDSWHSYDHEMSEFETVYADGMLLLTDNAHATSALADFATQRGLTYDFWREQPRDHWYEGGGIGAAGRCSKPGSSS